jgi:hypothetical protein
MTLNQIESCFVREREPCVMGAQSEVRVVPRPHAIQLNEWIVLIDRAFAICWAIGETPLEDAKYLLNSVIALTAPLRVAVKFAPRQVVFPDCNAVNNCPLARPGLL